MLGKILRLDAAESLDSMSESEAIRVYQFYLPLYYWMRRELAKFQASRDGSALVIGLSCPQGGGKTTLVDTLEYLFAHDGKSCATVSIDDFYLTHQDQLAVGETFASNRLLQVRGNPGTHDMSLALGTLEDLVQQHPGTRVPRYDKSAFSGKGDRADGSQWTVLRSPPDIVLLEGWCLGFRAKQDAATVSEPDVEVVDRFLAEPDTYRKMHHMVDAWIVLKVASPQFVYNWREQAEAAMRAAGKPAMTEEEVKDFVNRYMPAYATYLPGLYDHGPDGCLSEDLAVSGTHKSSLPTVLTLEVDSSRNPVEAQLK